VLDMERTEVRRNSEWFDAMGFEDVLKLASRMTVAQMIQRDTFQTRMRESQPIGIHEFLYPLMQGHDSVEVRADLEIGGTDQTFNLLVGRELQKQLATLVRETAESGRTPAEVKLERYAGPWQGSVDPVFREFAY